MTLLEFIPSSFNHYETFTTKNYILTNLVIRWVDCPLTASI
jgi:hypothetical protein